MSKRWRPKDWDAESIVVGVYQELTTESTDEKERKLVEAGADAMLEALYRMALRLLVSSSIKRRADDS